MENSSQLVIQNRQGPLGSIQVDNVLLNTVDAVLLCGLYTSLNYLLHRYFFFKHCKLAISEVC